MFSSTIQPTSSTTSTTTGLTVTLSNNNQSEDNDESMSSSTSSTSSSSSPLSLSSSNVGNISILAAAESTTTPVQLTPAPITAYPLLVANTNIKYVCEICGILMPSMDTLRQHSSTHNDVKIINHSEVNTMKIIKLDDNLKINCEEDQYESRGTSQVASSKISSIIAAAKTAATVSVAERSAAKKCSPAIINIPQSMTVFNLKDISSKLSSLKPSTSCPSSISSTPIVITQVNGVKPAGLLSVDEDQKLSCLNGDAKKLNSIENTSAAVVNDNNKSTIFFKPDEKPELSFQSENHQSINKSEESGMKTIIRLEDGSAYFCSNGSNLIAATAAAAAKTSDGEAIPSNELFSSFIINNVQPSPLANYSGTQLLPYHYSECQQIFVCNLCKCTYDSLRSIKAHLWKHSGHPILHYPIHSDLIGKPILNASAPITNRPTITANGNTNAKSPIISAQLHQSQKKSSSLSSLPLQNNLNITMRTIPSQISGETTTENHVAPSETSMDSDEKHQNQTNGEAGSKPNTPTRTGGGICQVLLEVIEKLRDAETHPEAGASDFLNDLTGESSNSSSKKSKRKLKSENNNGSKGVSEDQSIDSIKSDRVKKAKIVQNSEEKKLRKKRTSKKLCQLLLEKNELMNNQHKLQTSSGEELDGKDECTIETSVVNSLYEDEDALLNKFDTSVSLSCQQANSLIPITTAFLPKPAAEPASILAPTSQQVFNVCFVCFKCLTLFNDLSLLGEHKQTCNKDLNREELSARLEDSTIIYLCDLCCDSATTGKKRSTSNSSSESTDQISSSSAKIDENNNNQEEMSYDDTTSTGAGLQVKCFNKLELLIDHYSSEHDLCVINKFELSAVASSSNMSSGHSLYDATSINNDSPSSESTTSINSCTSPVPLQIEIPTETAATTVAQQATVQSDETEVAVKKPQSLGSLIQMLESLVNNNDDNEQYVCNLCSYVCYHLPSLKSHLWTHVTNDKFDYSTNTCVINAALDFETKLSSNVAKLVASIKLNSSQEEMNAAEKTATSRVGSNLLEKKIVSTLEMIDFEEICQRLLTYSNTSSKRSIETLDTNKIMVSFKCSKCSHESIDLCNIRFHKRVHN